MLKNEVGEETGDQEGMCGITKMYFDKLYEANAGVYEPVLSLIQPVIANVNNERLISLISKEELYYTLIQMHPDKSLDLDGLNSAFYQNFWNLHGDDIFTEVKIWLERGFLPPTLNDTNICLILKCGNHKNMTDLHHISLCSVAYKMVSKLLSNRLKKYLDKCTKEEQSVFVEGRFILDNVVITFEVIHALKRRTKGNTAQLALKIDISKAYDSVDWGFFRGMLHRLGVAERWIQWMIICVTSVSYFILVNVNNVGTHTSRKRIETRGPTVSISLYTCHRRSIDSYEGSYCSGGYSRSLAF